MNDLVFLDEEFGKLVLTTKQIAASKQIEAAIFHFEKEEYESAITLAAAAEGLMSPTENNHIFSLLKRNSRKESIDYNLLINWLKHPIPPDKILLPEFEVAIIIMRAISKLLAVYGTGTKKMREFGKMVFEKGHLPLPDSWK